MGDAREYAALRALRPPLWGDRRHELAVIGVDLDQARVRAELDACLRDDAELGRGADRALGVVQQPGFGVCRD